MEVLPPECLPTRRGGGSRDSVAMMRPAVAGASRSSAKPVLATSPASDGAVTAEAASTGWWLSKLSSAKASLVTVAAGMAVPATTKAALVGLAMGAPLGVVMEKGALADPWTLGSRAPASGDFSEVKFLLGSVGTSAAVFAALSKLGHNVPDAALDGVPVARVLLGGVVLGITVRMSGCAPPTDLVQLGAGVDDAGYAVVGGVAGAAAYGMLYSRLDALAEGVGAWFGRSGWQLPRRLTDASGSSLSPASASLALAAVAAMAVVALERAVPSDSDATDEWVGVATPSGATRGSHDGDIEGASPGIVRRLLNRVMRRRLNPGVMGCVTGLFQIPAIMVVRAPLGITSAYVATAGHVLKTFGVTSDYLTTAMSSTKNFWQIGMCTGIVVGAAVSTQQLLSKDLPRLPVQMRKQLTRRRRLLRRFAKFLGGFVSIAGARLMDGCAVGHCVSGAGALGASSWAALVAVVVGSSTTAALMRRR